MTTLGEPLTLEAALEEADRHGRGSRRLRDLATRLAGAGKIAMLTFGEHECEAFLDIAWQEIDETRYLTPAGASRTLHAVAVRVLNEFGTLTKLARSEPWPGLDTVWFGSCARIEQAMFDWDRWVLPWLVPAVASERRHSDSTQYYVWEGAHSTVTLALGLLRGDIVWQPVSAIFCGVRPE